MACSHLSKCLDLSPPTTKPSETLMDSPNQPGQNGELKSIGIIGAGPAGLAALKVVLDSPQFKSGIWKPTVFEAREDVGGVWLPSSRKPAEHDVRPPPTPLYDSLTTNLPHPIMAFSSFSFPHSTPLFPPAATVETYLRDYASHFHLRSHIHFNTSVEDISYDGEKWVMVTAPTSADGMTPQTQHQTRHFDLLFVCNGHYSVPRYPSTPGLESWLLSRCASHSVFYRNPSISGAPFSLGKSHKVLVIGGGPSGQDIVADLHGIVGCVIHSASTHPATHEGQDRLEPTLRRHGRPTRFLEVTTGKGKVEFEGGIVEDNIDYCIVATGYQVSFPFFKAQSVSRYLINSPPPSPPPLPQELYNTTYGVFPLVRHIFPFPFSDSGSTPPSPTLAFLGLLVRVAPFPLVEAQARAALSAFARPDRIDWTRESTGIMERYRTLKSQLGLEDKAAADRQSEAQIQKAWCRFEPMEQFDYRDLLADLVDELDGTSSCHPDGSWMSVVRSKSWERELYDRKDALRRTWRALEASGEAEEWARGVGAGGHSEEEWVDLMWRVVRKGEGDEKDRVDENAVVD